MTARVLRRNQTEAEAKLWMYLKNRQLNGAKFRRQRPVGNYICDFVCLEAKLVIELDGSQHNEKLAKENDQQRTLCLESQGFKVMRFWNNEVLENIEGVVLAIKQELGETLT